MPKVIAFFLQFLRHNERVFTVGIVSMVPAGDIETKLLVKPYRLLVARPNLQITLLGIIEFHGFEGILH
jgi:hypothetical protein